VYAGGGAAAENTLAAATIALKSIVFTVITSFQL